MKKKKKKTPPPPKKKKKKKKKKRACSGIGYHESCYEDNCMHCTVKFEGLIYALIKKITSKYFYHIICNILYNCTFGVSELHS